MLTRKNCLVSLLIIGAVLFINSIPALAEHNKPKEYSGHWAEKQLTELVEKGIIKGYEDGSYKLESEISRAEFIALTNRVFNFSGVKKVSFSDAEKDAWYTAELDKAAAAGYLSGDEEGRIKPNDIVSRIEASKILAVITNTDIKGSSTPLESFKDFKTIPDWGKGYISTALEKKFFYASTDAYVQPYKSLTRAEAITAIYKAKGGQVEDKILASLVAEKEYKGVLFTTCCKKKAPEKETKMCLTMPGCAANGYGINVKQVDGTYKYYRFDEDGHQSAKENVLDKTTKNANITIKVLGIEGESEDGRLKVISVAEYDEAIATDQSANKSTNAGTVANEVNFSGTLIDKHCFDFGDPESDTVECLKMEGCALSGYGIAVKKSDGSFVFHKFDEQGQKLATEILKNTKKENNVIVLVKGFWDGVTLKVSSLIEI